jgi:hypothetical protein
MNISLRFCFELFWKYRQNKVAISYNNSIFSSLEFFYTVLFSIMTTHFAHLPTRHNSSSFSVFSAILAILCAFDSGHPTEHGEIYCGFDLCSVMISDAEHFLQCLVDICSYSVENYVKVLS